MVKDEKTSEKVWSIYNGGKEREVLGGWEVAIMYLGMTKIFIPADICG
jgi:hypothetical protein